MSPGAWMEECTDQRGRSQRGGGRSDLRRRGLRAACTRIGEGLTQAATTPACREERACSMPSWVAKLSPASGRFRGVGAVRRPPEGAGWPPPSRAGQAEVATWGAGGEEPVGQRRLLGGEDAWVEDLTGLLQPAQGRLEVRQSGGLSWTRSTTARGVPSVSIHETRCVGAEASGRVPDRRAFGRHWASRKL